MTAAQFDKRADAQNVKAAEQKKVIDELVLGVSTKLTSIDDKLIVYGAFETPSLKRA